MIHATSDRRLNSKVHPLGWTLATIAGFSASFRRRSHAACTKLDLLSLVALHNGDCLDVRVEAPPGMTLTEAYRVAK